MSVESEEPAAPVGAMPRSLTGDAPPDFELLALEAQRALKISLLRPTGTLVRTNGAKMSQDEPITRLFPLIPYAEMDEAPVQNQLVSGLLISGSLFVIFGESNSGKTFFILDLALAIAAGTPWRGARTQRGVVVYIAGEGGASVRARVKAYRITHPEIPDQVPFYVLPQAVNFLDSLHVEQLIDTIKAVESVTEERCVLVVVDTLARSIPGGDENSSQDMGEAIGAADALRAAIGCAVGFVHHAGKDPAKGARGSSALRAACDTEIIIDGQSGPRTATASKQRDLECGKPHGFELDPIRIGEHPDTGESVTSCVVRHTEAGETQREAPKGGYGVNQIKALGALREWARTQTSDSIDSIAMRDMFALQGIPRNRKADVLDFLCNAGVLTPSVGGHTIIRSAL